MDDLKKEISALRKELRFLTKVYLSQWGVKEQITKPKTRSYGSFKY